AYRVLLLDPGLGAPGDAFGHVGRRARGVGRVRRALPPGRDGGDHADARRHRAHVRGDAGPLTSLAAHRSGYQSAATHLPARITPWTARLPVSSTRSARWPTSIRPRSSIPSRPSGFRLAAATAAGSEN